MQDCDIVAGSCERGLRQPANGYNKRTPPHRLRRSGADTEGDKASMHDQSTCSATEREACNSEAVIDWYARGRRRELLPILWARSQGNCQLCKLPLDPLLVTVDHILARSRGGTGDLDNLQLLHWGCNSHKGAKLMVDGTLVERAKRMKPEPPPRPRPPRQLRPAEVQQWRELNQLTQRQLADRLGVHVLTVSKWERKVVPVPPWLSLVLWTIEQNAGL